MRLSVLGSGAAFSGCGCNAGYLVDGAVLVDCGAPVNVMAHRLRATVSDVRLILLTHFHADHTFGLPMVLGALSSRRRDDRAPLVIAGPVGTREYVQRLLLAGYGTHILGLVGSEVQPDYVALQDGSDVELAGYRVRAHAVVHSTGPSLAYALTDAAGATVGFSGDSTQCAGLLRALSGCDAFVCECTGWDGPVPGGHLWAGEVEQLVRAHPRTTFVLSHMDERRELRGALVAHDLLTLDIAPRAEEQG
ncbi:MAG: MBL fold metallo-hydrolase [Candidatus Dormibacteraeota bacterium]|nr:MBL fold metallo-hydrolase [Candidatus Dormibacteraeota bacterium]MBV9526585.1 MBL fold metallo-hydrolase [Candidatus Dormibacteraeota bacterium]